MTQEVRLRELDDMLQADPSIDHEEIAHARAVEEYDTFLCRWLRAREFVVSDAFQMLSEHLKWRKENQVTELSELREEDVLDCPVQAIMDVCPHWLAGFDEQHRPWIFHQYGYMDTAKVLQQTSIDNIVRHHIWEQEKITQHVRAKAQETGFAVETWCTAIDLAGMSVSQVTSSFRAMVKAFANVDQNHYPERCGAIVILNAPRIFPVIYGGIKPWLNKRTTSKIQVYRCDHG